MVGYRRAADGRERSSSITSRLSTHSQSQFPSNAALQSTYTIGSLTPLHVIQSPPPWPRPLARATDDKITSNVLWHNISVPYFLTFSYSILCRRFQFRSYCSYFTVLHLQFNFSFSFFPPGPNFAPYSFYLQQQYTSFCTSVQSL